MLFVIDVADEVINFLFFIFYNRQFVSSILTKRFNQSITSCVFSLSNQIILSYKRTAHSLNWNSFFIMRKKENCHLVCGLILTMFSFIANSMFLFFNNFIYTSHLCHVYVMCWHKKQTVCRKIIFHTNSLSSFTKSLCLLLPNLLDWQPKPKYWLIDWFQKGILFSVR